MSDFTGESLPLTELRDPTLRTVYDYWCRIRGERELPARGDISPQDMTAYLSRVMLIDVSRQPLDFVYRVFGSGIARATGKDYTGKSVGQLEPPAFAALIWRQYLEVVNERKPCLHGVRLSAGARFLRYQRLTLPLSADGAVIDKLLAVSIEDKKFWESFRAAKHGHAPRTGTAG
jgi:hypothetical protein